MLKNIELKPLNLSVAVPPRSPVRSHDQLRLNLIHDPDESLPKTVSIVPVFTRKLCAGFVIVQILFK